MMQYFWLAFSLFLLPHAFAQTGYWQQRVAYQMEIDFDVKKHQFQGEQTLTYQNNSPDTLRRVFYHLYFNAFQPGSMMDVRSRTITDPDPRVGDRIFALTPEQIGYLRVEALTQDKKKLNYQSVGTILEVELDKPLLPGQTTTLQMTFAGQVPIQVRRSGRDSREGVDYSMAQWYPKLCEYDIEGWHANPYIGREFHGVWGDFDVKISIDEAFILAGTGILQNPQEIGYGYEDEGQRVERKPKNGKLTWHFKADNVHDFVWAADTDYLHDRLRVDDQLEVHFFYLKDVNPSNWKALQPATKDLFQIMNQHFGRYPYSTYSVIQGGDGGMEYPMATLITGQRSLNSLIGVTIHEVIHSWYQMLLATNEAKYPWMDEGFTSYAQDAVMDVMAKKPIGSTVLDSYRSYFALVESGKEEPLTTHADHYQTNRAYGIASYVKGALTLHQLGYIIGQEQLLAGMRLYFQTWKYKHPTDRDFKRIMERASGIELDWYFEHWVGTINTIDYGIRQVVSQNKQTTLTLERIGAMPMPLEVVLTRKDGKKELYYIPLRLMRQNKNFDKEAEHYRLPQVINKAAWPWTHPTYALTLPYPASEIERIEIDPSQRMADIDRSNNTFPNNTSTQFVE